MSRKCIAAISASIALFAATSSAQGAIILANPSAFNGAEVLFNKPSAVTSGPLLLGFTNLGNVGYNFEGTTITGAGGTIGTSLFAPSGGQAVITADGYSTNRYPRLTSLTYYRADGGTFNNTEFKLEDLATFVSNSPLSIQLYAWNQNGDMFDLGALSLGGDNRFGIQANNGDTISRVSYTVTGGAVGRHKQTRVENVVPGAVPEPMAWMMMLLGFGVVGGMLRSRKTAGPVGRTALPQAV